MYARRTIVLFALWLIAAMLLPAGALGAPPDGRKTEICHFRDDVEPGDQVWKLLEVNDHAVSRHVAHGDGFPGQAVPGTGGMYEFNDACTPVHVDVDGDGIRNDVDNCPLVAKPVGSLRVTQGRRP